MQGDVTESKEEKSFRKNMSNAIEIDKEWDISIKT
jgi:hypothetical protein